MIKGVNKGVPGTYDVSVDIQEGVMGFPDDQESDLKDRRIFHAKRPLPHNTE